jgi:putative endonuclease
MNWYVYIAQAKTGRYCTGVSTDPVRRIHEHNEGLGAKFSKDHGSLTLLYISPPFDKSTAWKREWQIKGWRREKKEKLISGEWK